MNNNDVLLFDSSDTWLGRDMWFGRLSAGEKFNDRMIAYKRASYF